MQKQKCFSLYSVIHISNTSRLILGSKLKKAANPDQIRVYSSIRLPATGIEPRFELENQVERGVLTSQFYLNLFLNLDVKRVKMNKFEVHSDD